MSDAKNIFELYVESNEKPELHVDRHGNKTWYLNGKMHREDGPAYVSADGSQTWLLHGKMHRNDGPAFEWSDGSKAWYVNGTPYPNMNAWVKAIIKFEGKKVTPKTIEMKIQQVMQQDLFN